MSRESRLVVKACPRLNFVIVSYHRRLDHEVHQLTIGIANGKPSGCFCHSGSCGGEGGASLFDARPSGEDSILPTLPPALGARFSCCFSHTTTRGTTDRIHRESVTSLYRASPTAPHYVYRGAFPEPGNAKGYCRAF